jgi:hypothetical protein
MRVGIGNDETRVNEPQPTLHATGAGTYQFQGHGVGRVLLEVPGGRVMAAAAGPSVTVENGRVDLDLARDQWDFVTLTGGACFGYLFGHVPGAIIGAGVCWAWGRWRWTKR